MESQGGLYRNSGPGLYEFLMEAELQQYYTGIKGDLKVQSTAQLKYVTEEDLTAIGMSKPEMRRLKKYFQKHFPQNYLSKFKKMLLPKREEPPPGAINVLSIEKQDKPPIKVPNKHMIPADAIIVNKELGIGEFGIVQQGVWSNDGERIQVAIKCLSRERMQNNPIEFLKEAAIMHAIDHEHIVRLYGVVLDTNSLMLVTELAPLRSLLECLKQPSLRVSFPVISLCDFAIQIADGMQYLEAKRLIHRDLAARNILVFSKNKVKISDFGLSRALGVGKDYYQTNFNVNLKLPIAWCAPECISYLKFTSSSDVWAYGVTLWEMFSYGFQPWAALTGHQILEAIDEPNFQRLEQPDCCPKEYYTLMQQCWQHEPAKRPKFSELIELLPDLKPEQVQAVQDNSEIGQLSYRQGDVITVLNKGLNNLLWKGVLSNGKTGLFSPAHTIAYLGSNLPSNKPGEFLRGDGKNAFSSHRRKIRTDMISSPQGDLRHTGHVGLDGAYFGDISFLGESLNHENSNRDNTNVNNNKHSSYDSQTKNDNMWSDAASGLTHVDMSHKNDDQSIISMNIDNSGNNDHEYHEISDEENQDSALRFDKPLDFDFGPSLLDEMDQMFRSLGTSSPSSPPGHPTSAEQESSNVKNELREMQSKQSNKKKQATVKPISAADQKTLYSAIAMAQELTARSMTDLEYPPESPVTSASPSRRRKFSFKLPHQHSPKPDRRHFAEEAASIPDIQWLCSSLQSLSSTVSSLESLGAPSTLKLPLWDKASAEFCFAKSRELLTKSNAWTTYMDMAFDNHMLNNKAMKQNLVKSTEFLEASNSNSKSTGNYGNIVSGNSRNNLTQGINGKASRLSSPNLNITKDARRISASYIDRYFEQSKNYDTDDALDCATDAFNCYKENVTDKDLKSSGSLTDSNDEFSNNFYKYTLIDEPKYTLTDDPKYLNQIINKQKFDDIRNLRRNSYIAESLNKNSSSNSSILSNKYQSDERFKNSVPNKRTVDYDIFDKFSKKNLNGDEIKNIKVVAAGTSAGGSTAGASALSNQDANSAGGLPSNRMSNLKQMASISADNSNDFVNSVRVNSQNYQKNEFKKKSCDLLPYSILHNPLFISEPIKKDIDISSSSGSESLRLNFERLRLQSDIETKNQIQLNSKISIGDNYQCGIFNSKNVKHYPDDKKRLDDGIKLTQNTVTAQFDSKNMARNSRNLELMPIIKSDLNSVDVPANDKFFLSNENGVAIRDPTNRANNIAQKKLNEPTATGLELHLNTGVRNKMGINSKTQQRLLEFPRRCRNELINRNNKILKQSGSIDNNKIDIDKNPCRPRTFSLSDAVKNTTRKSIRSFYSSSQCSDDSDSIFYSDTDIRSRLKFQRRRKKVSGNSKIGYNKKNRESIGVYPNDATSYPSIQNSEKSPLPSTSFLNSLSSQFSLCNQTVSWPESAPSSSQTFTSNSELDSDSSSEYSEFMNDT
ncbi:uncharacterized protein LOC130670836 isoform X2 [Microplitis mediator]|uniref:uncharacterized protein LOC130670836 isoform X2 n=1 Tax=Microplitis mediator TaxID=375433 RepID=UPI0025555193|nr:uncharacterized protein LOC130670836 isoform X2 [Microplitis mediator]